MEANEYFEKSDYSKIDFGSNPKLFSKKELIDFAEEYHKAQIYEMNMYLIENYAKKLRPYPPKEESASELSKRLLELNKKPNYDNKKAHNEGFACGWHERDMFTRKV